APSCDTPALDGCLQCCRRGCFEFGGEYLLMAPHQSNPEAFTRVITTRTADGVALQRSENVPFDFNLDSSFRAFLGYKTCECGDEVRFTYTHYMSDVNEAGTA